MITSKLADLEKIELEIKIMGHVKVICFDSVEDALNRAILLINSGYGIPKRILIDEKEVVSESDINLFWEQSKDAETKA